LGDWNLFFATSAGSAATLAGLLFVATQLHTDIFTDPTNRWAAVAQSTLTILSSVLGMSLSFLIPDLPQQVRADLVIGVSVLAIWRTIRIWWPVVRLGQKGRWQRFQQSFWLLIIPVLVYGYLVYASAQLFRGDQLDGLIAIASSFLGMFALTVRNSWRLVATVTAKPG
jgi:hypothetical protein